MNAQDWYRSDAGKQWHARNRAALEQAQWERKAHLRTLVPRWAEECWLEVGCGEGYNLYQRDIGVDLRPELSYLRRSEDIRHLSFQDASFSVSFCIGVLMHLPDGAWQQGMRELARVSRHAFFIGEYFSPVETDLHWNPDTGSLGSGPPALCWARPYDYTPPGWHVRQEVRLPCFPDIHFKVYTRKESV